MKIETLTGKTPQEIVEILNQDLPDTAYGSVPGGANLTGIDPTYRNERLTECFGLHGLGWGLESPKIPDFQEYETRVSVENKEYSLWCIGYDYAIFWYKVFIDDVLTRVEIETSGYSENANRGWAFSGAKTSAIGEAAKYLLWQMKVYKGEYKAKPQSAKKPSEIVLSFGQYKGQTLEDVWNEDSGYVKWLMLEARQPWLKKAASELAQEKEGQKPEQKEKAEPKRKAASPKEKAESKSKYPKENTLATNQQRNRMKGLFMSVMGLAGDANLVSAVSEKLVAKGNRKLNELGPVEAQIVIDSLVEYQKKKEAKTEVTVLL